MFHEVKRIDHLASAQRETGASRPDPTLGT